MKGQLKTWRLVYALTLGFAFGGIFSIFVTENRPELPSVAIVEPENVPVLSDQATMIKSNAVETPEESPITLLVVGDIMLDRNVRNRTESSNDPAYPFLRLPEKWIERVDLAMANLEGPVTSQRRPPDKTIDFQFDPSVIEVLKSQGFDAFSQANNHALDQGDIGYVDSVSRLRAAGFLVYGHQVKDDVISMATTTVNGVRFALLGFNTTDNPLDREQARAVIAQAISQADHVIVYMHWGSEYRDKPDASSVEVAKWLIDEGVDVVIGTHPHWVQGISSYKNKPIIWSLGNFIFDQDFSEKTRQGLAIELILIGKNVSIKPIPLQIDQSQPRVVDEGERQSRLEDLANISDPDLSGQIRNGMINF